MKSFSPQSAAGRGVARRLYAPVAAARPRDRHTRAYGSERSISKPGQALPPPTGAAAWISSMSGRACSAFWLVPKWCDTT